MGFRIRRIPIRGMLNEWLVNSVDTAVNAVLRNDSWSLRENRLRMDCNEVE
jgi:hypothetical protein